MVAAPRLMEPCTLFDVPHRSKKDRTEARDYTPQTLLSLSHSAILRRLKENIESLLQPCR
jgi:hypothetical protein